MLRPLDRGIQCTPSFDMSEILRPESFYERRHQLIYSANVDLAVNQKPVDILTVKEQLSKRGDLED